MTVRYCEQCGSDDLQLVAVSDGYWRKECVDCGSTGAFVIAPHRLAGTRPRPDFDPRVDYPERYTDGPV